MAILKEDLFLWAQRGKSSSWRDGSILPEGSQSKHRICFILPARRLIIPSSALILPACRRLLFPLLHAEKVPFPRATKEIGDVCTQATLIRHLLDRDSYLLIYIRHNYYV